MRRGNPVVIQRLVHVLYNALVLEVKDGILLAVDKVEKLSQQSADMTEYICAARKV